jgi:heme exporter protein A
MTLPVPLLEARGLCCVKGEATLFENLGFSLSAGEALQVAGANGSGKTSLLRILSGLTPPDEGEVRWRGSNIMEQRAEFHGQLAYLGHHLGLKSELTVEENLRLALGIRSVRPASRLEGVLEKVSLDHRTDMPVRTLSAGQRQRVALARMLLSGALLWILDEPFTALDAAGVALVQSLAEAHLGGGGVLVLTSHQAVSLSNRPLRKLELA